MRTDVVIVGAGPAGCAAAIAARRAGLRVVVCEASAESRVVPGETLHPGIESLLKDLGVLEAVLAEDFARHEGVWVQWSGPRRFEAYGHDGRRCWRGFQVDRRRLNEILVKATVDAGAAVIRPLAPSDVVLEGNRVAGLVADGKRLTARWIVDATGRRGWLARELGLRERVASPQLRLLFGWLPGESAELAGQPQILARNDGWRWEAPLGDRTAWVNLRVLGCQPGQSRAGLETTWRTYPDCAGPGYFLVGDSATVLDPASSHGVLNALMTGILCGHLLAALQAGETEDSVAEIYRRWVRERFEADVTALKDLYATHPNGGIADQFGRPSDAVVRRDRNMVASGVKTRRTKQRIEGVSHSLYEA